MYQHVNKLFHSPPLSHVCLSPTSGVTVRLKPFCGVQATEAFVNNKPLNQRSPGSPTFARVHQYLPAKVLPLSTRKVFVTALHSPTDYQSWRNILYFLLIL